MYKFYRKLSPLFKSLAKNLGLSPGRCRYRPTCSHYSREAISTHGYLVGSFLSLQRVLKCHPWSPGGHDPVPPRKQ